MLIRPLVNFRIISHLVLIDLCPPGKPPAAGLTCCAWCAVVHILQRRRCCCDAAEHGEALALWFSKLVLHLHYLAWWLAIAAIRVLLPEAPSALAVFPNRAVL